MLKGLNYALKLPNNFNTKTLVLSEARQKNPKHQSKSSRHLFLYKKNKREQHKKY